MLKYVIIMSLSQPDWGCTDWRRFGFRTANRLKMPCGASNERSNRKTSLRKSKDTPSTSSQAKRSASNKRWLGSEAGKRFVGNPLSKKWPQKPPKRELKVKCSLFSLLWLFDSDNRLDVELLVFRVLQDFAK